MLESIGVIFTVLAIVFVRKQDIVSFVSDGKSFDQIDSYILFPDSLFRSRIVYIDNTIDKILENGIRFYFSMFMISLLYTSFSFVFSLHFNQQDALLISSHVSPELMALAGLSFSASAPVIYMIAHSGTRMVSPYCTSSARYTSTRRRLRRFSHRRNIQYVNLLAALCMALLSFLVYNNWHILAFTCIVGFSSVLFAMNFSHWITISKRYLTVFAGATLGTWGLILVSFSFASRNMTHTSIYYGIGISLMSGALAVTATLNNAPYMPRDHRDFTTACRWPLPSFIYALGRPSLFVAFYCGRCPGQYCFAITTILVNVFWTQALLPDAIASAGAVTLACFTFFAGATSLAGAGIFAFAVTSLIAAYMLFQPSLLFTVWPPSFMLWILFPLVTSTLDWVRWSFLRKNIHKFVMNGRMVNVVGFIVDFGVAIICYYVFIFCAFLFISAFNEVCVKNGFDPYFSPTTYIASLSKDPIGSGLWLHLMALVIFLPSIIQYLLILFSGYSSIFSPGVKHRISSEVRLAASAYAIDRVAWKIAVFDVLGRAMFVVSVFAVSVYVAATLLPLFEYLLIHTADYGLAVGKSTFSWLNTLR